MLSLNLQIVGNNQSQMNQSSEEVMNGRAIANFIKKPIIPVNDRLILIGEVVVGIFEVISEQHRNKNLLQLVAGREKNAMAYFATLALAGRE
jgi:hypothetical protein